MRLKRDLELASVPASAESKLDYFKATLQDDNSNGPYFNDSPTWSAYRSNHTTPSEGLNVVLTNRHNQDAGVDNSKHHRASVPRPPSPHPNTRHGNRALQAEEDYSPGGSESEFGIGYAVSGSGSEPPSPSGILQHLAAKLLRLAAGSDGEDEEGEEENNNVKKHNNINCNTNNNNYNINKNINSVRDERDEQVCSDLDCNRLLSVEDSKKALYDKPKLAVAMSDAFLSSAKEELSLGREFVAKQPPHPLLAAKPGLRMPRKDSNRAHEEMNEIEKFSREVTEKERGRDECIVPRKKEKMALNHHARKHMDRRAATGPGGGGAGVPGGGGAALKKRSSLEVLGGFDVYNMETAMPRIDLDLIETHLKAAKEEERRRRNDREEIRRRLAMGSEDADYYSSDQRPGKKPSLQARLQSGMNLQICFMNETLSDTESPGSENENTSHVGAVASVPNVSPPKVALPPDKFSASCNIPKPPRPLSLPLRLDANQEWRQHASLMTEADFLARQAQLQAEARMALAQAKDMAHMQMEIERQRQNASPITEMVRHTLHKVGVSFPEDRRRLSRQILTEMNVAQLQVIVNDLHTQIEFLNESLVRYLMERDDLHMEQDSMLVDIEDLTRYLGAKEQCVKSGMSIKNSSVHSNGLGSAGRIATKK